MGHACCPPRICSQKIVPFCFTNYQRIVTIICYKTNTPCAICHFNYYNTHEAFGCGHNILFCKIFYPHLAGYLNSSQNKVKKKWNETMQQKKTIMPCSYEK